MDASPLFDPQYLPIIVATLVGFGLLAALLLVPIYRFLDREEEISEQWTREELARKYGKPDAPGNGSADTPETDEEASSGSPASDEEAPSGAS